MTTSWSPARSPTSTARRQPVGADELGRGATLARIRRGLRRAAARRRRPGRVRRPPWRCGVRGALVDGDARPGDVMRAAARASRRGSRSWSTSAATCATRSCWTASGCGPSSTSTPATPRSGTPRAATSGCADTTSLHGRRQHRHRATATLPAGGIRWQPMRQPVVIDAGRWARGRLLPLHHRGQLAGRLRPGQWNGRTYGVKAHEFRRFCELPAELRPAVRGRARHPRRRRGRSRPAGARPAGSLVEPAAGRHARRLRPLRARFAAPSSRSPRASTWRPQRLVQRPHGALPGERPAGARAGHGLRPLDPDR